MIIDSHVHTFPYFGGPSGFPSAEEHLKTVQRGMYFAVNPPRRKRDNSIVEAQMLWNGKDPGPEGLLDVAFRVERFGRVEWTANDEDVWLQYFAPSLGDQISSPAYIVAEMDYAGVGIAVLQNMMSYGLLNDFFGDCVRQYPNRYIGLGKVREAQVHTDGQLMELRRCATELGLKGIFYEVLGFWKDGYHDTLDDPKYGIFWEQVRQLGLVVFWDPAGVPFPSAEAYTEQLRRIQRVLERYPGIPSVLAQALPLKHFARNGRYELPDVAHALGAMPGFCFEIAYPISHGRDWEYPYAETWPLIHQLYDSFGPDRLVWGSDMPNVLRFCTYRQSYEYLRHCNFLSSRDLDLILGENLARLFRLPPHG